MSTKLQLRAARVLGWIDPASWSSPRRDPAFLVFVRTKPCMVPGCRYVGKTSAHHEPPKSDAGNWDDRKAGPLCPFHHQDGPTSRHGNGFGSREAFEAFHGLDQAAVQAQLNAEYEAQGGPLF